MVMFIPAHRTGSQMARGFVLTLVRLWLPLAVVICFCAGLVYWAGQQGLRQGANDPQLQLAEDAAGAVARGIAPQNVVGTTQVDLAASLAPFVMVFDGSGRPVASSGRLDGGVPTLPDGLAAYMGGHNEDRITWQPRSGVRVAAVLRRVAGGPGGFVLAGRPLREVEDRESRLLLMCAAACIAALAATLVLVAGGWYLAQWWKEPS
jgi:hypothetical protein